MPFSTNKVCEVCRASLPIVDTGNRQSWSSAGANPGEYQVHIINFFDMTYVWWHLKLEMWCCRFMMSW